MTVTTRESRRVQPTTLQETSLAQTISFLHDHTPIDVSDTLVQLWADSTVEDADDDYILQWRIISTLTNRDIPAHLVRDAMEHCRAIHKLGQGDCLTAMYGDANTDTNRERRLEQETAGLAYIARLIEYKL